MSQPESIANMNSRPQRVLLETARYGVVGTLVLPRDGYRSRLSDFLNSSDRDFISLTEVRLQVLDENGRPGEPVEKDFVTVARSHVIIATTADD
jgi:hypothetical protein